MKRFVAACALVVGISLVSSAPVSAQAFTEGFETYPVGLFVPPTVNGWTDFGGSQPINISTTQAFAGTKSMRLSEGTDTIGGQTTGYGSDVYRDFLPTGVVSGGKYQFSWRQFTETGVDSIGFMYISTGRVGLGNFATGLDLRSSAAATGNAAGTNMLVVQDVGATPTLFGTAPQVFGAWSFFDVFIDLDNNMYNLSYNGSPVVTGLQWDRNPGDGVTLGGFDFWMQIGNADAVNKFVYYDNFSLVAVPEPSSMLLAPIGLAGWKLLRRRKK